MNTVGENSGRNTTPNGFVAELWRYPVKSLAGERVRRLDVQPGGIVGDRIVVAIDESSGRILTARQHPELLQVRARCTDAGTEIAIPGLSALPISAPEAARGLSDWLGRRVRLAGEVSVPAADRRMNASGGTSGRHDVQDDEHPDDGAHTVTGGAFVDEAEIHLLTYASLRAGRMLHPTGKWDPRRFRPNVLITSEEGTDVQPVEDEWVGRQLYLGDVEIHVYGPCERCVMVTRVQEGLGTDNEILRTLRRSRNGTLGIYGRVVRGGEVGHGAPVRTCP